MARVGDKSSDLERTGLEGGDNCSKIRGLRPFGFGCARPLVADTRFPFVRGGEDSTAFSVGSGEFVRSGEYSVEGKIG